MPSCDTANFQIFLNEFAIQDPDEFKIIVLDNGAFHKAKSLEIPKNIGLIFLPPYSPELNPAENIWAILKREFTNKLHKSLSDISDFITKSSQKLTKISVKSTCSFEYISSALNWTN
jgi:transposase